MDIREIQKLAEQRKIRWSTHCMERMNERDITMAEVKDCITCGEIIEDYPGDYPNPSCLIMGKTSGGRVLHIVCGSDGEYLYMITVYRPSPTKFDADMKRRK